MQNSLFKDLLEPFEQVIQQRQSAGPPSIYSGVLPPESVYRYIFEEGGKQSSNHQGHSSLVKQSVGSAIRHIVIPPLETLRPITLSSIVQKVNYLHSGYVLFAKVVADPFRSTATHVLIRDSNSHFMQLSSYNLVPADKDPAIYFPKGSYVAVIEPFMKNAQDSRANPLLLRCDHPHGIIRYNSKQEWLMAQGKKTSLSQDPFQLKELGSKAFLQGDYQRAEKLWSSALSLSPPESLLVVLNSNLAACNIKLEHWEAAYSASSNALLIDPTHEKAAYRKLTAALMMGRVEEVLHANELELIRENERYQLINKAKRAQEEINGWYNYPQLSQEAKVNDYLDRSHGDFFSSLIQEFNTHSMGRGIRAIKTIPKGTLVMAGKAFAAYIPKKESLDPLSLDINPYSTHADTMDQKVVIRKAIQKLSLLPDDSTEKQEFFQLARGVNVDNSIHDTLNIRHIEQTVRTNWFRIEASEKGCGFWLKMSLFNHSCSPNCTYFFIGDFMFVYATLDIEKGEELFISYIDTLQPLNDRAKQLKNFSEGTGFTCHCQRCQLTRRDRQIQEDEKLINKACSFFKQGLSSRTISQAKQVLSSKKRKLLFNKINSLPKCLKVGYLRLFNMEAQLALFNQDFATTDSWNLRLLAKFKELGVDNFVVQDIGFVLRVNLVISFLTRGTPTDIQEVIDDFRKVVFVLGYTVREALSVVSELTSIPVEELFSIGFGNLLDGSLLDYKAFKFYS
ncbi:hypothetical protein P9112_012524 [Eukaryota sp. TZLM1-RC]